MVHKAFDSGQRDPGGQVWVRAGGGRPQLRLANGEKVESHPIELATDLVVRASAVPPPEESAEHR
ncbi:hypothetical protein B9W62_00205 [Streptomyces sp. CS113]|nr:hypothetical protein B9W62_00205 [Streptomyces sp. CS113]